MGCICGRGCILQPLSLDASDAVLGCSCLNPNFGCMQFDAQRQAGRQVGNLHICRWIAMQEGWGGFAAGNERVASVQWQQLCGGQRCPPWTAWSCSQPASQPVRVRDGEVQTADDCWQADGWRGRWKMHRRECISRAGNEGERGWECMCLHCAAARAAASSTIGACKQAPSRLSLLRHDLRPCQNKLSTNNFR